MVIILALPMNGKFDTVIFRESLKIIFYKITTPWRISNLILAFSTVQYQEFWLYNAKLTNSTYIILSGQKFELMIFKQFI